MAAPFFHGFKGTKALGGEYVEKNASTPVQWCNSYRRPTVPRYAYMYTQSPNERFGPDPYDVNFCFPYHPEGLSSPFMTLIPFVPRLHARRLFDHIRRHPTDIRYMRIPLPSTVDELATWLELEYRRNHTRMVFAVMFAGADNTTPGGDSDCWELGAVMSLEECDPENLSAEIGMTINLRRHEIRHRQRMSLRRAPASDGTLAASLLIRYCFNLPTDSPPGLGLRRLGVHSQSDNVVVQRLTSSLGFRLERRQRWCRVVNPAKGKQGNGRPIRDGDALGLPGVDAFYFTMCWDEWESHGRELVQRVLEIRFEARL